MIDRSVKNSMTFQDAIAHAIADIAVAPLTEGDKNLLRIHLDYAIMIADQLIQQKLNQTTSS